MAKKNSKNNSGNNKNPAPSITNTNTNSNENIKNTPAINTEVDKFNSNNNFYSQNLSHIEEQLQTCQSEFENNFHGVFDNLSSELNEVFQKFNVINSLIFDQFKEDLRFRFDKITASQSKRYEMKRALLNFKEAVDSGFKSLDN